MKKNTRERECEFVYFLSWWFKEVERWQTGWYGLDLVEDVAYHLSVIVCVEYFLFVEFSI